MKTLQKQYDKAKQEQAGTGRAQAGCLTLSAPELATLLCACGILPDQAKPERDRGDGDER